MNFEGFVIAEFRRFDSVILKLECFTPSSNLFCDFYVENVVFRLNYISVIVYFPF